jgi:hypothetical protein
MLPRVAPRALRTPITDVREATSPINYYIYPKGSKDKQRCGPSHQAQRRRISLAIRLHRIASLSQSHTGKTGTRASIPCEFSSTMRRRKGIDRIPFWRQCT